MSGRARITGIGGGTLGRALVSLMLVALLAGPSLLVPAGSVHAAGASDIPGIPMPDTTVSGLLGGDIYDVVYSLNVLPGNVILASLTGDPGTDFDMYLFDSSATTVLASPPVGLVRKSTQAGSTELITYPSRAGGVYYLDLNGATDVQGTYHLTVSILPDTVVPTVNLRIQGGAASVSSPTVTLTIVAQDDLSGVDVMSFSTDGTTWSEWRAYEQTVLWTFPAGDGTKRLWVRVRDRAGNVSRTAEASTVLDTAPPAVVEVRPASGAEVASLRPAITVMFSKPMTPVYWTVGGVTVRPLSGGDPVVGTYAYDDAARTGTFVPAADLVAGTIYSVQLGTLYDTAGNRLQAPAPWTFIPKQPVDLSVATMPDVITSGASSVVIGTSRTATPSQVEIQAMPADATAWTTIATQFPDRAGSVRLPVSPSTTTAYRLHVASSPTVADSVSPAVTLPVRWRVTLAGFAAGSTTTLRAATVTPLLVQLGPARGPASVTFRVYQWSTSKRAWVLSRTAVRVANADGLAKWTWTQRPGRWYLRVTAAATQSNAAGVSAVYRWTVK